MKRILTYLAVLLLATLPASGSEQDVLWWMFDETTPIVDVVSGSDAIYIDNLVGRGGDESVNGKHVNGIRIGAYSDDALLGYLLIADGEGNFNSITYEMPTVDLDTGEGSWNAGPTYARISDYESASPSTKFMIELGYLNDQNMWSILAVSEPSTYENLRQFMDVSSLEMHTKLEWTGGTFSVPEPSSAILAIIGLLVLQLKRPRMENNYIND